jgi:hypothetical protein
MIVDWNNITIMIRPDKTELTISRSIVLFLALKASNKHDRLRYLALRNILSTTGLKELSVKRL